MESSRVVDAARSYPLIALREHCSRSAKDADGTPIGEDRCRRAADSGNVPVLRTQGAVSQVANEMSELVRTGSESHRAIYATDAIASKAHRTAMSIVGRRRTPRRNREHAHALCMVQSHPKYTRT